MRGHNISPKPEEGTFTYALLLARVSLKKIPPNTAINIPAVGIQSFREKSIPGLFARGVNLDTTPTAEKTLINSCFA